MAGMIPGVEAARRRRLHLSVGCSDPPSPAAHPFARRASFCLYSSNLDGQIRQTRNAANQARMEDELAGEAREAKRRLDEKLKTQTGRKEIGKLQGHSAMKRELPIEVYGSKKGGLRRFGWGRESKKGSDTAECAVCLESFLVGELLMNLPCSHKFHTRCLEPWLETKPHCPCCRTEISSSS